MATPISSTLSASLTPTPSTISTGQGSSMTSSPSTLYIYTFLVTVALVTGLSTAVVGRTYFLRRRYRRFIEHAVRTGAYIPYAQGQWEKLVKTQRPILHDAYITLGSYPQFSESGYDLSSFRWKWSDYMPFAAYSLQKAPSLSAPGPCARALPQMTGSGTSARPLTTGPARPSSNSAARSRSSPTAALMQRINYFIGPVDPIPDTPLQLSALSPAQRERLTTRIQEEVEQVRHSSSQSESCDSSSCAPVDASQNSTSLAGVQATFLIAMPSMQQMQGFRNDKGPPVLEFGTIYIRVGTGID